MEGRHCLFAFFVWLWFVLMSVLERPDEFICAMRVLSATGNLHGSKPNPSPVVLLVIDAINDFRFAEGRQVLKEASPMAGRIRRLKRRAQRTRIPTVYVNDNFGRWRSDFRTLIAHCLRSASPGRIVTKVLRPGPLDYFVLKPKHSGFYSTTLDLLLEHFGARTLIMTGLLADSCILFTAQDAYMRGSSSSCRRIVLLPARRKTAIVPSRRCAVRCGPIRPCRRRWT